MFQCSQRESASQPRRTGATPLATPDPDELLTTARTQVSMECDENHFAVAKSPNTVRSLKPIPAGALAASAASNSTQLTCQAPDGGTVENCSADAPEPRKGVTPAVCRSSDGSGVFDDNSKAQEQSVNHPLPSGRRRATARYLRRQARRGEWPGHRRVELRILALPVRTLVLDVFVGAHGRCGDGGVAASAVTSKGISELGPLAVVFWQMWLYTGLVALFPRANRTPLRLASVKISFWGGFSLARPSAWPAAEMDTRPGSSAGYCDRPWP